MEKARYMAIAAATAMVASVATARQCLLVGRNEATAYVYLPILRHRFRAHSMALPQRASRGDVDTAHPPLVQLRRHLRLSRSIGER